MVVPIVWGIQPLLDQVLLSGVPLILLQFVLFILSVAKFLDLLQCMLNNVESCRCLFTLQKRSAIIETLKNGTELGVESFPCRVE